MTQSSGFYTHAETALARTKSALRERGLPVASERVFAILWKGLLADKAFVRAIGNSPIPSFRDLQLSLRERLLLTVIDVMQDDGFEITPRIMTGPRSTEVLKSIATNPVASHVFMVHSGFAYMVQAFAALGRKCAVISSWNGFESVIARSRLAVSDVELIPNDVGCLLRLHKVMGEGLISTNCIDFSGRSGMFEHISPILPGFGLRCGHLMHFARAAINDDGSVSLRITRAEGKDPIELTKDFIRFSNGIPAQARQLSVGRMIKAPADSAQPGAVQAV